MGPDREERGTVGLGVPQEVGCILLAAGFFVLFAGIGVALVFWAVG